MTTIRKKLKQELSKAIESLRHFTFLNSVVFELEKLDQEVDEPCTIAVVGRVKAGKSTFINALLGEDLAKVGTTETTATINYFRYGVLQNPKRPVRCFWKNGQSEEKDLAFLNSLQGNDAETLRMASGLDHLEYFLPNDFLKQVTLVDTPGTMAAVDEHQNRTAEFMSLHQQLREQHEEKTLELGSNADAVIYLIGQVARSGDQALLEEFRHVTQGRSRAHNAIGIMAKIDLQPEIMERRHELAQKAASQLKESLNTVIPISAGLKRTIDHLKGSDSHLLTRLIEVMRRIPQAQLDKLLSDDELFVEMESTVDEDEREALLIDFGNIPWTVFTTISRMAAVPENDANGILNQLEKLSGFNQLNQALEQQFFKRSIFLRCYRIVSNIRNILTHIEYNLMEEYKKQQIEKQIRLNRFINFIRHSDGDSEIAQDLEAFVRSSLGGDKKGSQHDLPTVLKMIQRGFAELFHELETYNEDFAALEQLESDPSIFSLEEMDELRSLFGLYGLDMETRLGSAGKGVSEEYVDERQLYWRQASRTSRDRTRRMIAKRATERYGLIYDDF